MGVHDSIFFEHLTRQEGHRAAFFQLPLQQYNWRPFSMVPRRRRTREGGTATRANYFRQTSRFPLDPPRHEREWSPGLQATTGENPACIRRWWQLRRADYLARQDAEARWERGVHGYAARAKTGPLDRVLYRGVLPKRH